MDTLLFVYGTLKRGCSNYHVLTKGPLLCGNCGFLGGFMRGRLSEKKPDAGISRSGASGTRGGGSRFEPKHEGFAGTNSGQILASSIRRYTLLNEKGSGGSCARRARMISVLEGNAREGTRTPIPCGTRS